MLEKINKTAWLMIGASIGVITGYVSAVLMHDNYQSTFNSPKIIKKEYIDQRAFRSGKILDLSEDYFILGSVNDEKKTPSIKVFFNDKTEFSYNDSSQVDDAYLLRNNKQLFALRAKIDSDKISPNDREKASKDYEALRKQEVKKIEAQAKVLEQKLANDKKLTQKQIEDIKEQLRELRPGNTAQKADKNLLKSGQIVMISGKYLDNDRMSVRADFVRFAQKPN